MSDDKVKHLIRQINEDYGHDYILVSRQDIENVIESLDQRLLASLKKDRYRTSSKGRLIARSQREAIEWVSPRIRSIIRMAIY